MRQYQLSFQRPEEAGAALESLRQKTGPGGEEKMLFQVFSASLDREAVRIITDELEAAFPGAAYVGCSTCGNILYGDLSQAAYALTCTIFESASAKIRTRQYALGAENVDEVISEVVRLANDHPWVKMVMLYTTVWENSMSSLCRGLDEIRGDVQILGGGAFNGALDSSSSFVLSSGMAAADHSIVFAFVGGDDLVVHTRYISGWKPLGKEMEITKAEGNILREIEGSSAFETYRRYLKIENDDSFLYNTLEFPYLIRNHGISILRHPQECLPDGSLVMASDVETAGKIRLAYGDPVTIMENVFQNVEDIRKEEPDVIAIFSCAGRKGFWGDAEIGNETRAFQSIAPSAGFYTLSEFLRTGEYVNQHNLTLVIASMKETIPGKVKNRETAVPERKRSTRRISTVERLANFIEEATRELEAANYQLFDMNRKLSNMAITDGMTQLFNRSEIQRRITACTAEGDAAAALIMLDLDNFKQINDTFGHKEGDRVICALASLMKEKSASCPDASVGRWGGEEFMILLPGAAGDQVVSLAEAIREAFAATPFPEAGFRTVSLGVARRRPGEDEDSLVLRADEALYEAKKSGKNRTVLSGQEESGG